MDETRSTPEERVRGFVWSESIEPEDQYRTLIFAPTGSDARLTADFLGTAGILATVVENMEALCQRITQGCGAVVLAEEVLTPASVTLLFGLLDAQPAWSEVPVILITTSGAVGEERMRRSAALGVHSSITVLERPFRPATLISTLEVALRSRKRQYEVRRLLIEIGKARDAAERASHAKDEFLAALSHELRTPLNPVLLLATENARDESVPAELRRDFEDIARNVTLEARLIDDLLDITRISRGKMALDVVPLDGNAAVESALTTTEADFAAKKVRVEVALAAAQAMITADPVRLQQVLWNVLKNAAKFTPEGGRIHVASRNENGQFVVVVTDSGVGMDAAEIDRVFEAFTQGNHARHDSGHRFGGLGLGLAISRRLMELHGGTIDAASGGSGQGATFTVRFPLRDPGMRDVVHKTSTSGSNPPLMKGARRLLLVEDHVATRVSLARLLQRRGYLVEAAGSLSEARQALRTHEFDLMLSDLGLPDGSGYELMTELDSRKVACIALSGYGMEGDIVQSLSVGFRAHLTKPVSVEALDTALDEVWRPAATRPS